MKKVAFHNLGCKVNAYETEAMQQSLVKNGYEIVAFHEKADIYIINTCTVTNIADRKSRQMLHKAKKKNPDAIVVAAGCYAQTAQETCSQDNAVDLIIGNNKKSEIVQILEEFQKNREKSSIVLDIAKESEYEELSVSKIENHTRAYMKIQDGCNQFCSYCIIPFARGRVRSRRPEMILKEAEQLAEQGFQEIVLTGIHLSSYGTDLEGTDLLNIIQRLHEVKGIQRIRLGSLEPGIITEKFVKIISSMPKICPHFHLSLQSGCDTVLKRMNRRYSQGEYYEKCKMLRAYYKNPAITTDVIVGFPGETDQEFEITRRFLEMVQFYEMHIFKYSRREGTKAAAMPDQIDENRKTVRSNILLELERSLSEQYRTLWIGKPNELLIEERVKINGSFYWIGHTKEYVRIAVASEKNLEKCIIPVIAEKKLTEEILLGICKNS